MYGTEKHPCLSVYAHVVFCIVNQTRPLRVCLSGAYIKGDPIHITDHRGVHFFELCYLVVIFNIHTSVFSPLHIYLTAIKSFLLEILPTFTHLE